MYTKTNIYWSTTQIEITLTLTSKWIIGNWQLDLKPIPQLLFGIHIFQARILNGSSFLNGISCLTRESWVEIFVRWLHNKHIRRAGWSVATITKRPPTTWQTCRHELRTSNNLCLRNNVSHWQSVTTDNNLSSTYVGALTCTHPRSHWMPFD